MQKTTVLQKIQNFKPKQKILLAITSDTFFAFTSFYFALSIRDGNLFPTYIPLEYLIIILIINTVVQSFTFYLNGLYKGIWRYSSTPDLLRLIKGATIAVLTSTSIFFLFNRLDMIPRSAFIIDWLLLVVSLGGSRFAYRLLTDDLNFVTTKNYKNALIVGTGSGGERLFREIRAQKSLEIKVVAFLDVNKTDHGRHLHGLPIFGQQEHYTSIIRDRNISKIFIAIPDASPDLLRMIVDSCNDLDVEIKTIPKMTDFFGKKSYLSQLRNLEPEDLLGRKQVVLDTTSIENMLSGKKILVTGAGGSIGSELCNQIAKFKPKHLILFEQNEFNLYQLERNLKITYPQLNYTTIIGDVKNRDSVECTFKKFQPEIVFHAAAYKHVPLMEENPYQSVQTNILGTKTVAEISSKYLVDRFVLISTDKAVNPTNVMGATKRTAEMVCLHTQKETSKTKFMIVRFGNVLGSSGSVIPLFKKQIQDGGPITVTHKDIERYFMSIPEASRLVLQAGTIGNGGEIFVLDMGSPVKIVDLAKQMIALAGLRLNHDISIIFTGLRPGEKLYEELLIKEENILPTTHSLVKVAKSRPLSECFYENLKGLITASESNSPREFRESLKKIVKDYNPQNTTVIDQCFEKNSSNLLKNLKDECKNIQ
ncbi:nucleoside-diphosphate sugar epimerase/dehydratase [Halobacteriovorax sp. HLS]|uniref:polysaccharide biosynthesis protein n=1 Tax=Halobacteriovorax sp. HLS TaxID=2234000 RepID=UPI000FD8A04C|nr:nucleoside-diphosphate sugar epimerase/dehydratase [Halobacteriovorax sp. HLS]